MVGVGFGAFVYGTFFTSHKEQVRSHWVEPYGCARACGDERRGRSYSMMVGSLTDSHVLCALWTLHLAGGDDQLHCVLMLQLILNKLPCDHTPIR